METKFKIQLEFAGLAIFDPYNLDDFCMKNNIQESNIMESFINNSSIGDMAIFEGVVLPIYNIQTEDYNIIITNNNKKSDYDLFEYKSFPFRVTNNKVVISDIYALINWEPDFYKDISVDKSETFSQYAIYMKNGNYSVNIVGFYINENDFGYKLIFNNINFLPPINGDIDSYNFEVVRIERCNGKINVLPYDRSG